MQAFDTTNGHTDAPTIARIAEDRLVAPEPSSLLDFDSDVPLVACPMRNEGTDICESCQ